MASDAASKLPAPAAGSPAGEGAPRVGVLIRARRRQLKRTLADVSRASGVSVGYLSQIERDHSTPSLGTLAQVARALDVGIEFFIASSSAREALTRAGRRLRFSVDGSSVVYERLGAEFPGSVLSSFILTIPPGYRSETVAHEGEEILYMLEGSITQQVDDAVMTLNAGDSLHFRGHRPHAWWNDSGKPARMLWTGTSFMFHGRAVTPLAGANDDARRAGAPPAVPVARPSRKKGNTP